MKILVVDDDGTNKLILKGLLKSEGYDVVLADNGRQGVDLFEQEQPDMVLMDVMMPIMDGYEATKLIKEKCGERFVPVIFLTAMGGDDAMVACLANGGDDYIKKPFTRVVLRAKIDAMDRIRTLYQTVQEQKTKLAVQQKHIEREYEIAEKIFTNIMARDDVEQDIVFRYRESAETFNGDIVLAARNPNGGLNLLVGDFTGHGLAAAIGAMPVADTFVAMTKKGFELEEITPEINKKVKSVLPTGRFLAATLLQVDSSCRFVKIWNGGMPEVLVLNAKGDRVAYRAQSAHLPFGILDAFSFESTTQTVEISPGSRLILFSDGAIETVNSDGEMYGINRIESIVTNPSSTNRIAEIVDTLRQFRGQQTQLDDVTLVEVTCDPNLFLRLGTANRIARSSQSTHWKISFFFDEDTLRKLDPMPIFMDLLGNMQGMGGHGEKLFVVLSELYNNALDHGVLKLDSRMKKDAEGFTQYYIERDQRLKALSEGFIRISFDHRPHKSGGILTITVEDSGDGFNVNKSRARGEAESQQHDGRGIGLVRAICESVTYSEQGNSVEARYVWEAE